MKKIFTKNLAKVNKDKKFIGGYVSDELMSYLALYSIATDIPKSTIFKNILTDWHKETLLDLAEDELIDSLVDKAMLMYKQDKHKKTFNVNVFYAHVRTQLNDKRILKECIDKIVTKLKTEIKQNGIKKK